MHRCRARIATSCFIVSHFLFPDTRPVLRDYKAHCLLGKVVLQVERGHTRIIQMIGSPNATHAAP